VLCNKQIRTDESVSQLIHAWQPFMLTMGELMVDIAKSGKVDSPSAERLELELANVRDLLPGLKTKVG
jgi:hypothetical protein